MSNEVWAVIGLFVIRLGIPLVVTLTMGMLLSQWDNRQADSLAR